MKKLYPDMYKKDIYEIDYKKLNKKGIKALLYDLDNTLIEQGNYIISDKAKKLVDGLKKDFIVYIVSNSINSKKIKKVSEKLSVPYIKDSRKPFKRGYKKLKLDVKPNEIAMIGDQIITDVFGAKRMGYYSVLIDPINNKEWIGTKINRVLENLVLKRYGKKRGDYFD